MVHTTDRKCAQQRPWLSLAIIAVAGIACLCSARTASAQTTGTFDNKLLCMADMVSNVEDSCSKGAGQAYYTELEDLLKRYLGQCFNTNFTGRALHLMLPDISPAATAWLNTKADQFKALQGIEVVTTFVPYEQINVEIEFELGNNLTYMHDGWILDPMAIADIYNLKGFLDLRPLVSNDSSLAWSDVLPYFDTKAGEYDGSLAVMPMDGHVELLYYRKDLFAEFGLAVPNTWDDMVDIAWQWNQTLSLQYNASAPNVTIPYAVCLERRKACGVGSFQLLSVAAPYLQYSGSAQGIVWDPSLLDGTTNSNPSLVSNPAMLEALTIYANLSAMSPPYGADDACVAPLMSAYFATGQCLMTIGLSDVFKATNSSLSTMRDNVGVAPAPGVLLVLDRTTQLLVPCTAALCPNAEPVIVKNGSTQLVNRAPFAAGGGWVAAVNARSAELYQNYSYAFFSFINSPEGSFESLVTPGLTDFSPYRRHHFTNISAWTNAGFSTADTTAFLVAGLSSLLNNNMAMDLRVEPSSGSTTQPSGTKSYRDVYNNGVANLTSGSSPQAAMQQMSSDMAAMLSNPQETNLALLSATYRLSIEYLPPGAPPGPLAHSSGSHLNWVPIAIVLPVVCTLLLIAAGVVYEIRNTRKHKNLFGKVVAPGLGADTTILITDIQDSVLLWEGLTPEVMDKTVREHHECIRKLLSRHSGYESATEGESFILAFHSPKDALLFAMEVQEALLHVDWPVELLEVPLCAPVYVQGTSTKESRPKHLQDILDVSDQQAGMSPPGSAKIKGQVSVDSMSLHDMADGGVNSPAIPALVNVPLSEVCSFAAACQKSWTEVTNKDEPNKVLIFRGLRVRMGVHAGIHHEADVTRNRADGRTQYSGETITLGRAVADASHGGMVLISEETYKKLPLERLWVKYLVLHVGEHKLTEALPNLNLYHALNRTLEGRLAYLGPQRTLNQIDPGVLEAPVGCITVAFMNVVGAQTLLSWNADVAQHALKTFHSVVGEELKKRRGYLVEAVDGLFLAAFQSPVEAILWALQCNEDMVKQDWPEALLSHELCEELTIGQPKKNSKEIVNITVFRGLRLKTGVDTGQVLGEVHAMTGRMTYRGKVMNRAARIAGTSSTGQVLASVDSWTLAVANDKAVLAANKINSMSLGHFRLKGVAERIEVFHCRKVVTQAQRDDDDDDDPKMMMMGMPGGGAGSQHWKWDQHVQQAIGPEDIVLGSAGGKGLGMERHASKSASMRHAAALATNDTDEALAGGGSDVDGNGSGRLSGHLKAGGDGKAASSGSPSSDDQISESLSR